jgi:hypothetical protein
MSHCHVERSDYELVVEGSATSNTKFQFNVNHFKSIYEEGPKLWDELHTKENPRQDWLDGWVERIPKYGCKCAADFDQMLKDNPPRFSDWLTWTWEIHNTVNAKLNKPEFSRIDFLKRWHINLWPQQPKMSSLIAVTSLAPHRLERQKDCLNSWKKFGLDVVSVNSQAEIDSMASDYPQVDKWAASEFDTTPKINSLIDVADAEDTAVLVINADIAIYGDQSRLADLVANRKSAIGIRNNYESKPSEATREKWGLDAFLIYPEQVASISKVDFAIGKPMWDYWLAEELETLGDCDWIGEPYFFHRSHPVAWTQEECAAAHDTYAKRFKPRDWAAWRRSKPFG